MPGILNINVADIDKQSLLNKVECALVSGSKYHIVTANPEILLEAQKNESYKKMISQADILVADGIGLKYWAFISGQSFKLPRIIGVDLAVDLLRLADSLGKNTLIIGGSSDLVIQKATQVINLANINSVLSYSDQNIVADDCHLSRISNLIQSKNISLVILALGHVKQELFISKLLELGHKCIYIGVGGTFDYLSGNLVRPNRVIRYVGLEWLFRLISQPKVRIGRILKAVLVFPISCIIQAFVSMFHVEQSGVDKQ